MKAIRLVSHGKPGHFELQDLPDLVPDDKEVVVEVHACGLNHLDLWLEEDGLPIKIDLPRTPGSESAGRVLKVGSKVTNWKAGDRVAIQSNIFCGTCEFCLEGEDSICVSGQSLGIHREGGFAEQILVPERALLHLPDQVPFETSAALSLAASTAMHMLTKRVEVKKDDWVLVIGAASGVGSAAIQIAKQLGAKVVSTASCETKKELAHQLGADAVVDLNNPKWPSEVRSITNKRGVDLVVEHAGGDILVKSFQCLARNGAVVTCGATTGREITMNIWPLFVKKQRLIGSYGRNRDDLETTLAWAAEGKLKPTIDSIVPLNKVPDIFSKLRARQVLGKVIVTPQVIDN